MGLGSGRTHGTEVVILDQLLFHDGARHVGAGAGAGAPLKAEGVKSYDVSDGRRSTLNHRRYSLL